MGRFYETMYFDGGTESGQAGDDQARPILGWRVLASPATINRVRVPYEELLDVDGVVVLTTLEPPSFDGAMELIGDPFSPAFQIRWRRVRREFWNSVAESPRTVDARTSALLDAPIVAAEASPLEGQSLRQLCAPAELAFVAEIAGQPTIVIVGASIGLVVIRGLTAVGRALWKGGREEVTEFGADATAALLESLRRYLGIARRSK